MARTLVCFHAHPDDESMLTAGTMARAAAEGNRVVLVVATEGERGDAELTAGLGTRRTAELARSADALGVARVEVLGYGDSGSGPEAAPVDAFTRVEIEVAAERLAAILREESADVLTVYDPRGGYGHPDHVRVHDVGYAAARLAGTPVVLEATVSRDLLELAAAVVPTLGFELPAEVVPPDLSTVYTAAAEVTHAVDVGEHLAAKRESMRAHVSQTTSGGSTVRTLAVFLALPDELFAAAFGTEWYVDRSVGPGAGLTDVFATLDARVREPS